MNPQSFVRFILLFLVPELRRVLSCAQVELVVELPTTTRVERSAAAVTVVPATPTRSYGVLEQLLPTLNLTGWHYVVYRLLLLPLSSTETQWFKFKSKICLCKNFTQPLILSIFQYGYGKLIGCYGSSLLQAKRLFLRVY